MIAPDSTPFPSDYKLTPEQERDIIDFAKNRLKQIEAEMADKTPRP